MPHSGSVFPVVVDVLRRQIITCYCMQEAGITVHEACNLIAPRLSGVLEMPARSILPKMIKCDGETTCLAHQHNMFGRISGMRRTVGNRGNFQCGRSVGEGR